MPGPYRDAKSLSAGKDEAAGRDEPIPYEPRNRSFIPLQ